MTGQSSSQAATPVQWWKPALFFLVVIIGLWYVKWQPYYGKAFTAAETHSIGKSILAQADANPLQAAWDYAMVYFLAVWKAAVLGVILGSLIQVLIPRNWLVKTLGQPRFQGTLLGTIFSLPGMMCSCCAAPVAAGMRRQRVSMGGARLALPACGWCYRQHAVVGHCDGRCRLPVCDPYRRRNSHCSDHDAGRHGHRTGAGVAHHAACHQPAVADYAA